MAGIKPARSFHVSLYLFSIIHYPAHPPPEGSPWLQPGTVGYILFGTEQVTDVSAITDMLSGLDGKYLPKLKELLGAYLKTITIAENQND